MGSHPAYNWTSWFYLILVLLISGCGSSGGEPVATGTLPLNARIRLVGSLEAASGVPQAVTSIRLVGQDAQGLAVYTETRKKASEIVYPGVPTSVVLVRVEYLVDGTVVGLAVAQVQLAPDQEYLLSSVRVEI